MKRSVFIYLVSCFILPSFLFCDVDACWGPSSNNFGEATSDYDILVGSDLVMNCTLFNQTFITEGKIINSSQLIIVKDDEQKVNLSRFIQVIDDRTIQLKIKGAQLKDTGMYLCVSEKKKTLICGTKVNVGYPPKPVKEFSCISKNFESLNCSWSTEENTVYTRYTIWNNIFNQKEFRQPCPNSTVQPTSCTWTKNTDPPFMLYLRNSTFTIIGNNSLGENAEKFFVDVYTVVIPNSPENLEVFNISEQSSTIIWKPPNIKSLTEDFKLTYEIWIAKVSNDSSEVKIYETDNNTRSLILENLIPYTEYNVSVRCRSAFTEDDTKWSSFTSLIFKTLADVPYKTPDVIPEAYELHIFEHDRSATLFWKTVPKRYHNAEGFYYHIKYFRNDLSNTSEINALSTTNSFITIRNLQKNFPYLFRIYSANEKGISTDYESILINSQDKILPAPTEIRVISQDIGLYNLSWVPPNNEDAFTYVVFWCSSMKPWLSRCDKPIQWINGSLSETTLLLTIPDVKNNYQFAVVSKLDDRSSSMKWESCILSHKGGLSKVNYVRAEKYSSTSLKVFWNLDCPAEKEGLKSYKITYCGVEKHTECFNATADPNVDEYLLTNLYPYTNYSIKIQAISKNNKSSEVSEKVYQSTSPGAPSGPPENINVLPYGTNAFFVSWNSPLEPNGIITKYIVSYNNSKEFIDAFPDQLEYNATIDELKPYSTYAVQIQACVNNDCSVKSEPVMIQTDVDVPGHMEPPRIEEENSTHFKVSWSTPIKPNGPIDFYQIMWHQERQNASSSSNNTFNVSGGTSVILDVKCPSLGDEGTKYLFYVRAVNKRNGTTLEGPYSESTQAKACQMPEGLGMFIGTIVGAAFGAIFFLIVIYRFALWMKLKIHQVKSITIRLPEGLEGPETNPLNNYESFKNGLNGNFQTKNGERLSYTIDENKNRHGSGSSQFSNSSAEEVMYKNEKCAKFGRKPSGDSSGCSSMSSSITPRTHLSSGTDSGAECDFVIPPSPDSAVTEPILLNTTHKTPLPILMEVHDQLSSEKNVQKSVSPEKQYEKHKNTPDDIILKIDPPYSKFGYAGNAASSVLWRVNPLVFYNCNLANSEPSVFDTQKEEKNKAVFAPYSKVGLAKSSGDVTIANAKQNGYSKFGLPSSPKRFSIPPPNVNPITMVILENPDKKEWPITKTLFDDNYSFHKLNKGKQNMPSNNLTEDTGYIKVGKNKLCTNTPSKGYVPFHEVRNQMDQNQSLIADKCDHTKTYLNGNDQIDIPDDSEWPSFNHNGEECSNVDTPEILFDIPFPQNSIECAPLDGRVFGTNDCDYCPVGCQNPGDPLSKLPTDSDLKLSPDSPILSLSEINFENSSFLQNQTGSLPNSILNPTESSVSPESHSSDSSNKNDCYGMPNEVIMTPVTLKNGYVPFHSLSDSMCDKTHSSLPNNSKLTNPQNWTSNSVCPTTDNCKTSTHYVDKLLRHPSLPLTVPTANADSSKDTKRCFENNNGYSSLSLNYVLKPLPKMESEICEV